MNFIRTYIQKTIIKETNLSYEAAYEKLAQIVREIERDTVSIDVLAKKVKRASELITYCQNKEDHRKQR